MQRPRAERALFTFSVTEEDVLFPVRRLSKGAVSEDLEKGSR
ncbi:hypothetical protein A176_003154 [Myxococcus hansupus]|uniref:Uncharacterized protein n=1 Tax=Pseudomyxococcus hansupus TaxID=1297742 RepID=A0A0H4XDV3_9BACT|nr:hypothetical protein A176_003154 [Myxococcus hansupus]